MDKQIFPPMIIIEKEKQKNAREAFFSYFYFALNVGSLFSNTILVYYEDSGMWTMGFLVSLASAVIALVSYLAGYQKYKYVKAHGNPVIRVVQVFVATARKWKVGSAKEDPLYEVISDHLHWFTIIVIGDIVKSGRIFYDGCQGPM